MSEKIVVGVTEAAASRRAVDWAAARATARKQHLELVSIVGGAIGAVGEADILTATLAEAQAYLEAEAARIAADGLVVMTRVEAGNPVHVLIEASRSAALLVIGSDYRGPGQGPARGAHGIRIAAAAHSPVIVVPDFDVDVSERRGVVVGVDGSPVSEHAIAFAAAEADRLGEPLTAVTVWTPISAPRNSLAVVPEMYRSGMQGAAQEALSVSLGGLRSRYPDLEITERVAEGYPSQVLNELGESARLTVVGTRGHGRLRTFLLGSISHEVLQRLASVTAVVR